MKTLSALQIVKAVVCADSIGKTGDGNIVIRQGYYYRYGYTEDDLVARVRAALIKRDDIEFQILKSGDHWAAFRGGASLASSSHWYVIVKVNLKESPEVKA